MHFLQIVGPALAFSTMALAAPFHTESSKFQIRCFAEGGGQGTVHSDGSCWSGGRWDKITLFKLNNGYIEVDGDVNPSSKIETEEQSLKEDVIKVLSHFHA